MVIYISTFLYSPCVMCPGANDRPDNQMSKLNLGKPRERGISPHFDAGISLRLLIESLQYPAGHGFRVTSARDVTAATRPPRSVHRCVRFQQEKGGTGQRNTGAHKAESLHLHCMVRYGLIRHFSAFRYLGRFTFQTCDWSDNLFCIQSHMILPSPSVPL
jgi:hypothetical protein